MSKILTPVKRRTAGLIVVMVAIFASVMPMASASVAIDGPAQVSVASATPTNAVAESVLLTALRQRMDRVREFKFIREHGKKMGVKIYLFGGTASGFAHYVRWDLLREAGDARFQPDRFDYDFTNIYRSNQDLDVVVDGKPDQIKSLQAILAEKFPYAQGSKSEWEVRSLREDLGPTKMALLNNADFLNQNSDSNSTGLIEITESGDPLVRDLFRWESPDSQYLQDIAEGKIHYYDNPLHETTQRAREGKNPKIISVVRYLIKAVQFDLEIRPSELVIIKKIISDFNPKDVRDGYVERKLEEIAVKLAQNAVNLEYANQLVNDLGIKQKLMMLSDASRVGSMAWWLNREPLRSHPLGQGGGQTARELGLTVVAHETNSFPAYESITRAHTGEPNVLISRKDHAGEAAFYGDGFYTKVGRVGARGTGLTIRFEVNPNAREGSDFIRAQNDDYIIFRNKKALRVVQESLNLGAIGYLQLFQSEMANSNRGVMEKLKRRLTQSLNDGSAEEQSAVARLVQAEIDQMRPYANPERGTWAPLLMAWVDIASTAGSQTSRLLLASLEIGDVQMWSAVQKFIMKHPESSDFTRLTLALIERGLQLREYDQKEMKTSLAGDSPLWLLDEPDFKKAVMKIAAFKDKYKHNPFALALAQGLLAHSQKIDASLVIPLRSCRDFALTEALGEIRPELNKTDLVVNLIREKGPDWNSYYDNRDFEEKVSADLRTNFAVIKELSLHPDTLMLAARGLIEARQSSPYDHDLTQRVVGLLAKRDHPQLFGDLINSRAFSALPAQLKVRTIFEILKTYRGFMQTCMLYPLDAELKRGDVQRDPVIQAALKFYRRSRYFGSNTVNVKKLQKVLDEGFKPEFLESNNAGEVLRCGESLRIGS